MTARWLTPLLAVCALVVLAGPAARPAHASATQQAMMMDDPLVAANPVPALQEMRNLGVDRVRYGLRWQLFAPHPNAKRPPARFNGADPADYPAAKWQTLDQVVEASAQTGVALDLDLVGGAPRWARGPGEPKQATNASWNPDPRAFQAFAQAVGTRYSGNYDPATGQLDPGNPDDLPRVSFWSVWNEPDYGPSLAPQGLYPGHLLVPHSPELYRGLVDAEWSGLHASGHGGDTFLFGEVAPRGATKWGVFSGMEPLVFLRSLYCLGPHYHPLRGKLAKLEGCPRNAAGTARFRARNPALFQASGFSDHPYSSSFGPAEPDSDTGSASLVDIGQLESALDRVNRAYGSSTKFPIWNTEYGYITSPPKVSPDPRSHKDQVYVSPAMAATFMNQAEYISWQDPRIQSYMQYLLIDPLPRTQSDDYGGFASGLINFDGTPKADYYAWLMPLWVPVTNVPADSMVEVWGGVRPARWALSDDPYDSETAQIQFEPDGTDSFQTLAVIPITQAKGYFDTQVHINQSGTLQVSWTYPTNDPFLTASGTITSRQVHINAS